MFLNTLKLLYLLKLNSHVRHLFYVMKVSTRELVQCSVVFAVFMFGCIHVGYILFGRELYSFSSPLIILQSPLVEGVFGGGFSYFYDCCTVIGPAYFTAITVTMNLICIAPNIGLATQKYRAATEMMKEIEALERKLFFEQVALNVTENRCNFLDDNYR